MDQRGNERRRTDAGMAESIQFGVSLLFVAGKEEARRYLVKHGAPAHVIERILAAPPSARRPYGSHGSNDRRKTTGARPSAPPEV
ncbi:hypothetical protein [Massilia sp. BJB1822]|uniref:hypothetical protein n=1 Tax=Massilia sp. BJB1822 TaxID=2744470 RepID=UPI00159433CB|nr:hypothetical protein [Massilia sp. BJB1822]NVE00069.1 hypothetical protein [Massilia sp. BJB1822]